MKNKEIIEKLSLSEKASLTAGKNFWESQEIDRLDIPSFFMSDGPHGLRKQSDDDSDHLGLGVSVPATCFPPAATTANSFNPDLLTLMGEAIGLEARANNVSVLLGPGVNIKRNPRCGRNFEYYSEDPFLAGKLAAGFIRGVQSNGIYACVKHFAANNSEYNRFVSDSIVDERALREIYLTAFELAVKEGGVMSVMTSYNLVNGIYGNENSHLLQDILRKEWGFNGLVVSDWGSNNEKLLAVRNGANLEMPYPGKQTANEIIDAVRSGILDEGDLDLSIDPIISCSIDSQMALDEKTTFSRSKHHELATIIAEESIVLLKNTADILPLSPRTKVAIIGEFAFNPRYQGAGSSVVNPICLDKTIDIIKNYGFDIVGEQRGFKRYGGNGASLRNRAVKLAEKSDVILLYLGLDEITESEGTDRKDIALPANQLVLVDKLHALGKKIVVVLSAGSAIEMDWDAKVDAVVHSYLGGQGGATAVLNIIAGLTNPSGKLAESYPHKYEDIASSSYFLKRPRYSEYRESIYVGYRYFEKTDIATKYPFGFGLSYTTFRYSDLRISAVGATFNVENTGNIYGKETTQLYVSLENSRVPRPLKELKGFAKVGLKPGEKTSVFIPFDEYTFRYFETITNRFETEGGEYKILVGSSSSNIILSGVISIKETMKDLEVVSYPNCYMNGEVGNVTDSEFENLLGRAVPKEDLVFISKKRIQIDLNTTVEELKYSRGWLGRFFAFLMRTVKWFVGTFNKKGDINMFIAGLSCAPLRSLSRLTAGKISWGRLSGYIEAFNGNFSKGMAIIRADKKFQRRSKSKK